MIFLNQSLRAIFTIKDQDGNTVDLSTYNPVDISIKTPANEIETVVGTFLGDGSDGVIYHDFAINDLDQVGLWYVQCDVTGSGTSTPSNIINFKVIKRL